MVDKFHDPLLTPKEAARHLRIPESTLYGWLNERVEDDPLVHAVRQAKRGAPTVPFIAVVECYVLRSLRDLSLSRQAIRDAAATVRREFGTPYGLATQRIATDGVDIFVHYLDDDEIVRARDGQRPIRDVIDDYLRYIHWDESDGFPQRLRLRQYSDVAPVIIDPRFGWGTPVLETAKVPVDAIVGLCQAGESLETVAEEFEITSAQAEEVCRAALASVHAA
ncbi:DUF433 domain-containing protein [Marinitenerispora sediminis]|uniref:DUF433 domain-containing protein n=1 Tax=Marinitenerispora sediminis TaxID=1931232 RepID=A0A368T4R6_9ACTN|nr:DUF433 domain-containing protein [Marinitenerispora sediminis]RCV49903.1 DUF433 domain-containing protein [Marinitenerispora sediminis]RCV54196.1 DUF433 domain-containing protein [Marinitenerispora sediminis]RCV58352.1 DUF433 domain-containing protein [Marinitenerispora sediminis]